MVFAAVQPLGDSNIDHPGWKVRITTGKLRDQSQPGLAERQ